MARTTSRRTSGNTAKAVELAGARVGRGPMADDNYTRLHNIAVRGGIPTQYVGVFGYIASHTEGWRLTQEQVARDLKVGVAFVRSALKAIEAAGCLIRTRERTPEGTLGGALWFVTDLPMQLRGLGITDEALVNERVQAAYEAWLADAPTSENRTLALTSDNTEPDERLSRSEPKCGQPTLVEPPEVDPTPKKIKGKKTKGEEPSSPPTPTPPSAGAGREDQGEGETASPNQSTPDRRGRTEPVSEDALAVVRAAAWPLGKPKPTPVDEERLAAAADACVAAGHALVDVRRELAAAMDAQRPIGAAITRLRQLAGTTPLAARAAARPRPTAPAAGSQPSDQAPQPASERHTYRDGGPNGACATCGRSQPAPVHLTAPRAAARCPHGRVPAACPTCRAGVIDSDSSTTHAGNGA